MSDPIFQKSLQDLIKGIRSHKKDPSSFISQSIADIKIELRSTDPFLKTEAIRKLTYLQMIGYNVSWASFAIVEVMSQSRFAHKRVGYLAANQSFTETTDVILLTTNLFKKEFAAMNSNQYEIGLAINCLANISTKDLARDCISDLVGLMNHTRPYVRKKAVLAMFKLYVKFPQGLRLTFDKLKERLDDSESSVISTAVNVICELANKNPRNYLAMAPKFFRLLTTSSNNWMLIKVVKLLGSLVSEEPRLARKLLEPLSTIIQNTGAKSLQYECIHTVTMALPYTRRDDGTDSKVAPAVVKLCSDYLKGFIEDHDQNLKYLGLVGLVELMKSHPRSVVDHRELVLRCLTDDDITIRTRALELLAGIVSRKSLVDLVHHLLEHVKHSEGAYRDEIIAKVLYMCSKEKYGLVTDFAWYTSVLLDLAVMQGSKHGQEVADQLIEISLRVDTVRPYAVESMLSMLLTDSLILGQARQTVSEVLKAAAWIVGEYSEIVSLIAHDTAAVSENLENDNGYWIEGPTGEDIRSAWRGQAVHVLVVDALLHPRATNLPPHVQSAYIQSAMKVFVRACRDCTEGEISQLVGTTRTRLGVFLQSVNLEVQERASTFRHLLAEMDVLSMSWEAMAEEVAAPDKSSASTFADKKKGKGKGKGETDGGKKATVSLLDEMVDDLLELPEYTALSVQAVDDQGAQMAKRKSRVLGAAVGEAFYAVHSKAQRRVPVPEGLSLTEPFNASALNKLLAMELPDNLSLATLAFTVPDSRYPEVTNHIDARNDDGEKKFGGISSEDRPPSSYSAFSHELNPNKGAYGDTSSGPSHRGGENDMFYLSSGNNAHKDVVPLSQILAETFEDKKGGKKGKKKDRKKGAEVGFDSRDMLPAGAVDSDDDDRQRSITKKDKKESVGSRRKKGDELELVDINAPLGADDVLPTFKHREVPTNHTSSGDREDKKKKDKKKVKEGKEKSRDKESEGKKPKERDGKKKAVTMDDLLDMDWGQGQGLGSTTVATSSSMMASMGAPTQTNTMGSMMNVEKEKKSSKSKGKDKDKGAEKSTEKGKSSSGSKKSGSHVWLPLANGKQVEVFYASSITGSTATVTLRAVNNAKDGSAVAVTATFSSNPSMRPATPSASNVRLSQQLPAGSDCQASTDLTLLGETAAAGGLLNTLFAPCVIHISTESLLGPDMVSLNGVVKIPPSAAFTPHKVDEQGFAVLLGKSSSRWASGSVKVPFSASSKPKSVLKAVGGFLHAHTVEGEATKAASMCAKSPSGGIICLLAKLSEKSSNVTVDIKCLCASKPESQALADAIALALGDLSL